MRRTQDMLKVWSLLHICFMLMLMPLANTQINSIISHMPVEWKDSLIRFSRWSQEAGNIVKSVMGDAEYPIIRIPSATGNKIAPSFKAPPPGVRHSQC